ncbi:MAG: hypothetical protein K6E94_03950 [Elusimicrobiaceae bacterium]|nr:hypothetical protein [Elusimicrobiaceae bacterium]
MKKQIFTLLTLLLCVCSGAWADETTIGRTVAFSAESTAFTYSNGTATDITVTASDASGCKHASKAQGVYFKNTSSTSMNKEIVYRNIDSNEAALTSYNASYYAGFQAVIPSGKKFTVSSINVEMATSADFSWRVEIVDGSSTVLFSSYTNNSNVDYTISNYNRTTSTNADVDISPTSTLTLTGTIKVRLHYWTSTTSSKYMCPLTLTLTGEEGTVAIDTSSPSITSDLDDENAYTAFLGVEKTLSIGAEHVTGYQWYTCTNAAGEGASPIGGATSYYYSFTPSVTGTYYYKCIATNTNATGTQTATSKVATVNVEAQTPVFSLTKSSIAVGSTSQIIVGSKAGLDGLAMTDLTYDDTVISISASGAITALAKGTSTITFTTAASGNYAAGSASLSITVTGKVVASSTPSSWTGATSRTWSVSSINLAKNNEDGDNGLYFKAGSSSAINYSSGTYFSLNGGNIMYLEVPSATSTGIVTVKSTQTNNERYLQVVNSEGTQNLTMSTSGSSVRFDANSIEEIDGKYYIKLSHGKDECKIAVSNFATVTLDATVNIGSTGWATFSSAYPLDFANATPSGLTAYMVTGTSGRDAGATITPEAVDNVPGNTGLLLNGAENTTYTIPVLVSSSTSTTSNLMKPVVTATTVKYDDNSGYNYVLADNEGTPEFQQIVEGTYGSVNIAAGKAYLSLTTSPAPTLSLFFNDMTGIDEVRSQKEEVKGAYYNLAGQRVAQPTKGLYIVNGKKVVVR